MGDLHVEKALQNHAKKIFNSSSNPPLLKLTYLEIDWVTIRVYIFNQIEDGTK